MNRLCYVCKQTTGDIKWPANEWLCWPCVLAP